MTTFMMGCLFILEPGLLEANRQYAAMRALCPYEKAWGFGFLTCWASHSVTAALCWCRIRRYIVGLHVFWAGFFTTMFWLAPPLGAVDVLSVCSLLTTAVAFWNAPRKH